MRRVFFSSDDYSGLNSSFFKMKLDAHNFYHPFANSTLGFFDIHELNQSNVSYGLMIKEIDLYSQPLEKPSIVITFWVIKMVFIIIGEGIGTKLFASLKKEKGLLTDVTKLFIIVQMILFPILHFFELVLNTLYPVHEIVGSWFCFLDWLLWGVFMRVGLNNSFIASLMRYLFIVHDQKVNEYGKEKIKRLFLYFSIISPIIQFTLQALGGSPRLSFVNKCYGNDHKVFLIETSTLNVLKHKFVEFDDAHTEIEILQQVGARIFKIVEVMLFLFMGCNITEVFLYYKIFSKMDR